MLQSHKGASETPMTYIAGEPGVGLQSHKGASETWSPGSRTGSSTSFNPTRVHLKLVGRTDCYDPEALQSHKGASETERPSHRGLDVRCFNPTRVHLKRCEISEYGQVVTVLQSHKGSSETMPEPLSTPLLTTVHTSTLPSTLDNPATPRGRWKRTARVRVP